MRTLMKSFNQERKRGKFQFLWRERNETENRKNKMLLVGGKFFPPCMLIFFVNLHIAKSSWLIFPLLFIYYWNMGACTE